MFKKAIPLVIVSGFALAGCGNNDVPKNNETPMESLDNDLHDVTPRVNNGAGPDMDGIDNGTDRGNGVNDGVINDNNRNNGVINDNNPNNGNMNGMDNNTDNGIISDDSITNPNDTNTNRNGKNGMDNNR